MSRNCKNKSIRQSPQPDVSKSSKGMNATFWDDHSNQKEFLESLSRFMNESWAAVCQIRERSGLSSQYEPNLTDLSKRIEDISKKLDEKYQEVKVLEDEKAELVNKSMNASGRGGRPNQTNPNVSKRLPVCVPKSPIPANFQPLASSTPARQYDYSGNYDISYSGPASGNSGWPSTTASSGGTSSMRQRLQFTQSGSGSGQYQNFSGSQNTSGSGCPPTCSGGSGQYQDFSSGLDYGF